MSKPVLRVIVGSRNPVKVNAVQGALAPLLPEFDVRCEGMNAPSGISAQPLTAAETRAGAINRVEYCKANANADLYVALEGGVETTEDGAFNFAYVAIANTTRISVSRSAALPLPPRVYRELTPDEELGSVMDRLFNATNSKQQGGAIGLLTRGQATRESAYTQALVLAMAPFLHPDIYAP